MNASGSNDESNPNQNRPTENEQQRKKGKGRQKITMAKIENETNLQVTFSKRRAGVFKKASELSTLCGAESAVVVFSPGNKPHSFGHPNVETVANRLLQPAGAGAPVRVNATEQRIMAHNESSMQQRNEDLSNFEASLEREKARKKELDSFISSGHMTPPPPLEGLSYAELEELKRSVLKFKSDFEAKLERSGVANPSPYNGGGGDGAAASAAAGGSMAAAVDPSYGYIPSYGGANFNAGGSYIPPPSYALPEDVNYGRYMVQYPGMSAGFGGYNNYGDPSAVVPYDAGTGSSGASADGGREAARADERSNYLGFGNNYRGHQF